MDGGVGPSRRDEHEGGRTYQLRGVDLAIAQHPWQDLQLHFGRVSTFKIVVEQAYPHPRAIHRPPTGF